MVLNPRRPASKGMDPPPAVMSNTTGLSVTKFWCNHSRSVSDRLCVKARGLEKPCFRRNPWILASSIFFCSSTIPGCVPRSP